jgi:hypothetical protein
MWSVHYGTLRARPRFCAHGRSIFYIEINSLGDPFGVNFTQQPGCVRAGAKRALGVGQFDRSLKAAQKQADAGQLNQALATLNAMAGDGAEARANWQNFHIIRARILVSLGQPEQALKDVRIADQGPVSARFLAFRADIEETIGALEAAIETVTRAVDLARDASLLARRATLYQAQGKFDAAVADLRAAIGLRPTEGELYRLLAGLHTFTPDDPLLRQMRAQAKRAKAGSPAAMGFGFAMAKALDDCAEYDAAFAELTRANAAMRARFPYDINSRRRAVAAYRAAFDQMGPAVAPAPATGPIFITGLPRSGTTLVEQILSCHAEVSAGGEAAVFSPLMTQILGDPARGSMDISPERMAALGAQYREKMAPRVPGTQRVTDKSIQTILYAGAVLDALPDARIISVTCAPEATALSLLKQVFRPGKQLFSYDLSDIQTYQDLFNDMRRFWHERRGASILSVAYEDLVSAPEPTIRAILAFLGLPWDPACLRPEDNSRSVRTLSAVAVRAPIGTQARDHWQNYAAHLARP